jgi:hypothetical protein
MLSGSIPRYFDELFQNRPSAPMTSNGELGAIMEVTIYFPVVFIVRILRSKDGVAKGTSKVFYMELFIEGCYVRPTQGSPTSGAKQIDATEIICFAESILQSCLGLFDGKEFRGDSEIAFLLINRERINDGGRGGEYVTSKTVEMEFFTHRSNEFIGDWLPAFGA